MRIHDDDDGHNIHSRAVVLLAIRSESSIIIQSITTCLTTGIFPYLRRHPTLSNQRLRMFDSEAHGVDQVDTTVDLPDGEGKKRSAT